MGGWHLRGVLQGRGGWYDAGVGGRRIVCGRAVLGRYSVGERSVLLSTLCRGKGEGLLDVGG